MRFLDSESWKSASFWAAIWALGMTATVYLAYIVATYAHIHR